MYFCFSSFNLHYFQKMLSNKKFVEGILYEIKLVGGTSDLVSLWN
jgi:hypothetical protein